MKDGHDSNVTLRCEEEKKYFPCPVCEELRELGTTSRGKPYLTCNDCGVQLFVRGKVGIKKLKDQVPEYTAVGISRQIMIALNHYDELRNKLIDIKNKKPIFSKDENLDTQELAIIKAMKEIERIL